MELWDSSIGWQLGLAGFIVHALEFAKKRSWIPLVGVDSARANRIVSRILSFFTAIGLQWQIAGSFDAGGTLTVTFPAVWEIFAAAVRYFASIVLQDGYYHIAIDRKPSVVNMITERPTGATVETFNRLDPSVLKRDDPV